MPLMCLSLEVLFEVFVYPSTPQVREVLSVKETLEMVATSVGKTIVTGSTTTLDG